MEQHEPLIISEIGITGLWAKRMVDRDAQVANENSVESEENAGGQGGKGLHLPLSRNRGNTDLKDNGEEAARQEKISILCEIMIQIASNYLWRLLETTIFRILAPNSSPSNSLSSAPTSANSSARPLASQLRSQLLHLCSNR